ncbi:MAG: ATP-binding protein [Clostridia bacterium]|nr:ATP-binding protein [Clostridia bacterium]
MLLNFKIKNFRSFRDETNFTMIPSAKKTHSEYVIKEEYDKGTIKALPAAIIYGANASGKSNIILAMFLFKKIVKKGSLNDKILLRFLNLLPFVHDKTYFEPTELEIIFCQNKNEYKYGIAFKAEKESYVLTQEYLYINDDQIFNRTQDEGIQIHTVDLMKKGYIQQSPFNIMFYDMLVSKLNETLDEEQLFLHSGIKNLINNESYNDIQQWFEKFMVVMDANDVSFEQKDLQAIEISATESNDELKNRHFYESDAIKEIVSCAEFGDQEIKFLSDMDSDKLLMVSLYKIPINDETKEIRLVARAEGMESKGTIQLLRLIQPFIDALKSGGVIVMDEMDASLHFELVVSLIRIFNNKELNKKGAQLIFNTHNPIYLDGELLRHDQVVMVEKSRQDLSSELYSLVDFGLRPEEKLLKNYLDGKYGALPHIDLEIAFKHIIGDENR